MRRLLDGVARSVSLDHRQRIKAMLGADGDVSDGVSALYTAGCTILCDSLGPELALGAMRMMVDEMTGRVAN